MELALGFVEAGASGQDDVGALEQRGLALAHLARGILEGRELVHAVVDDGAGLQVSQQRQRHRRVEPGHVVGDLVALEIRREQRLERRQLVVVEPRSVDRRVRAQDLQTGLRLGPFEERGAVGAHRFLDEDHVEVPRQP